MHRPWLVRSGNPLQAIVASQQNGISSRPSAVTAAVSHQRGFSSRPTTTVAASQHNVATSRPIAAVAATRPGPPLAHIPFSQTQAVSSQNFSQAGGSHIPAAQGMRNLKFMTQAMSQPNPGSLPWSQPSQADAFADFNMDDSMPDHHFTAPPPQDAHQPSQDTALRPLNTAARLLSDIQKQAFSLEDPRLSDRISKKLELVGSKQDVMSGQVDGIGKELAGQGAKLESLEATCSELVQALRTVMTNTGTLGSQMAGLITQRRPVLAEMGVQTSPALVAPPPAVVLQSAAAGPSTNQRLSASFKQHKPAASVPRGQELAASASKRSPAPLVQRGLKASPGTAAQASKPKTIKPILPLPERRPTRHTAAAASSEQHNNQAMDNVSSQAAGPVLSFSRKRRQESQQEDIVQEQRRPQPAKQARVQQVPAPAKAGSLFDSLFDEPPAPVNHGGRAAHLRQDLGDDEADIARRVQAKMQKHRMKLMQTRRRSGGTQPEH